MRLIDADKLIDEIDDKFTLGEIGLRQRDDIVDALEYAETVQPKWVKCTERLPKEDEEVLVYLYGDSPYLACVDSNGQWRTEDFEIGEDHSPLAWMPLPQPYLGDSE